MKLNFRETCSIGLLGLLLFIGCGDQPPFGVGAPPTAGGEAGEPHFGGSGGVARRDAGADGGANRRDAGGRGGSSSGFGSGGAPSAGRDAGRGGSGARSVDGGAGSSGRGGTLGSGARDAGSGAGGTGRLDGSSGEAGIATHVAINEIVADPQRDWNDTAGGGTPFDGTPGTGAVTGADEWIELYNGSGATLDLSGWTLVMTDGTPATEALGTGDAVLAFSAGGALTTFQPREYLTIGNPKGDLNNDVVVELYDAGGILVDRVALSTEGGAPSGNATGVGDEAIARVPDAVDTGDDAADFIAQPATPGAPN